MLRRPRRSLSFESLETRIVLAATADVVILIDTSASSGNVPTERTEFTAELVRVLDQKLTSRGIGGEPDVDHDGESNYPDALANRYKVIQWGSNTGGIEPVNPVYVTSPWTDAPTAAATIDGIQLAGGGEDGWDAIHFAAGYDENAAEGNVLEEQFRTNAAVHFVVVTDAPSHDEGPEPLGPVLETRITPDFSATYSEILTSLQKEHLFDGSDENLVSDAIVTFVSGANFQEDKLPSFDTGGAHDGYFVFGLDVNVQQGWDVDRDEGSSGNDSTAFIYDGSIVTATADGTTDTITVDTVAELGTKDYFHLGDPVMFESTNLPPELSDDEVYYIINRVDAEDVGGNEIGDSFQLATTMGGTVVPFSAPAGALLLHLAPLAVQITDDIVENDDYVEVLDIIRDADFLNSPGPPSYPTSAIAQDTFDGELYGYLTWGTGGTLWDIEPLFDSGNDIDSPAVNMFMQAMAEDIFEKTAMQVSDFNGDLFAAEIYGFGGGIGDFGDVNLLFQAFGTMDDDLKAVFDLDGNGTVDAFDVMRLVVLIYYTRYGDANLDGNVNILDLNAVAVHWQQNVGVGSWEEGDFNGDGFVDAADLNEVGINWQEEQP